MVLTFAGCGPGVEEARRSCRVTLVGWQSEGGEVVLRLRSEFPEGARGLSGLTVEIERRSASGEIRGRGRVWVPSPYDDGGHEGATTDVRLEGVGYEIGDLLSLSVRREVPRGERAAYREFGTRQRETAPRP